MTTSRGKVAILTQEGLHERRGFNPDTHVMQALTEAGWEVTSVVWQEAPRFDWSGYTAALIRSTWDYNEDVAYFMQCLRHIQSAGVLVCNDPEHIISWNYDKRYLKRLASHGIPTIPTVYVDAAAADGETDTAARVDGITRAIADMGRLFERGVIVKPAISLGSLDTFRITVGELVSEAPFRFEEDAIVARTSRKGRATDFGPTAPCVDGYTEDDKTEGNRWPIRTFASKSHMVAHVFHRQAALIQPFIPTVQSFGEVAVFYFGTTCAHALLKTPTGGDFRVQSQFGGRFEVLDSARLQQLKLTDIASRVVSQCIGATPLYARLDFVFVPLDDFKRASGTLSSVDLDAVEKVCLPDGQGREVLTVPTIIELELIEPYLFLEHASPDAVRAFVDEFHRQVEQHAKSKP